MGGSSGTSEGDRPRGERADDRPREDAAEWWQHERAQRWRYGLGAMFIGVLLPVAAGIPDHGEPVRRFGGPLAVGASTAWVFAAVLLFLASTIGRRERELVLAGTVIGLLVAHPILDQVAMLEADAVLAARHGLGAVALCALINQLDRTTRPVRIASWIVMGGALTKVGN